MEQKSNAGVKRRSKKQMHDLLNKFDSSEGITIKEFCKQHHINESTFCTSRKRYSTKAHKSSRFIALPAPESKESPAILFAEVGKIRLYQQVPADYLNALAR